MLDFGNKVLQVLKLAVNTGKAHVRDLVQLKQISHRDLADHVTFDFSLVVGQDFPFHGGRQFLDLLLGHGPLPTGSHHTPHDFFAVERLFLLVFLDDRNLQFGHSLKRGVTIPTMVTMPAAANHKSVVACPTIDDSVVIFSADRTAHKYCGQKFGNQQTKGILLPVRLPVLVKKWEKGLPAPG